MSIFAKKEKFVKFSPFSFAKKNYRINENTKFVLKDGGICLNQCAWARVQRPGVSVTVMTVAMQVPE